MSTLRRAGNPLGPAPRRLSFVLWKIAQLGLIAAVGILAVEGFLRATLGALELRNGHRWWVSTHLSDMSYEDFRERQQRIRATRERLGMERGQSHPVFGWTYNPTFRIDEPDAQIHINANGLRGREIPAVKPRGEIRILALGGSTTAGEEMPEAETYPAQLEALLQERHPDRSVRVINGGIPTYDLTRSLIAYAYMRRELDADFVTVYHGINDLFQHTNGGVRIVPKQNYSGRVFEPFVFEGDAYRDPLWREVMRSFTRRSLLATLVGEQRKAWSGAGEPWVHEPDPAGLEAFEARYRALVDQVAASASTAVPMTFAIADPEAFADPDREKIERSFAIWLEGQGISLDAGRRILEEQNRSIAGLARAHGLPLADVASAVPPDREHFLDVCHLTARGNRRIAERLAETLAPLIDELPKSG